MNEKDFSKVRIAIVPGTTYAKPEYLEDDGKLIRIFCFNRLSLSFNLLVLLDIILSEKELSNNDYLGLDHVDQTKSKSAYKPICIRG